MHDACLLLLALESLEVVEAALAGDLALELLHAVERDAAGVGTKSQSALGVTRRAWAGDVLVILENLACEVEVIHGPVRVVAEGLEEGRTGLVEEDPLSSARRHR